MNDCPFCDFKDKAVVVYEDDQCFAVISKNPINTYHLLVIPRKHFKNIVEIPDELAGHLFIVTKKLSNAVRKTTTPTAITHISDDDISGDGHNLVEHFKIHIIPRFKNDKVQINWNREADPGIEARSQFAQEIKTQL